MKCTLSPAYKGVATLSVKAERPSSIAPAPATPASESTWPFLYKGLPQAVLADVLSSGGGGGVVEAEGGSRE